MTADLDAKHFHDEGAAREFLEEVRWPDGPICPHCGSVGNAYKTSKVGVYRCGARECRKDFTVRIGTLFERSHIALHTWLFATHLLTSSKKGMSSHQMHRMLGVTYKTAWFMTHRIREAMRELHPVESGPLGGIDVKKLRERLGMSQPEFALKFGFSLGTLRQWEQGRRSPDGPARVLLTVISHSPTTVKNALEKEARRVASPPKRAAIG